MALAGSDRTGEIGCLEHQKRTVITRHRLCSQIDCRGVKLVPGRRGNSVIAQR